jgi:zinc and cadmium transporter
MVWIYTLTSVLVISLISLLGVITLSFNIDKLKRLVSFLVSFAAGAMLGGVFLHLLPELAEKPGLGFTNSLIILAGILAFFIMEKIVCWRHCHIPTSDEHPHSLGVMNIIGDGLHNFTDGIIIAAAFMNSVSLGLATVIAVILHEIPQEIGDFSVLIYAGYSKSKALLLNLLSALTAVAGAVFTLIIGEQFSVLIQGLSFITIGGFLYIAIGDLIPELKKETGLRKTSKQLVGLSLGIVLMLLLRLLNSH